MFLFVYIKTASYFQPLIRTSNRSEDVIYNADTLATRRCSNRLYHDSSPFSAVTDNKPVGRNKIFSYCFIIIIILLLLFFF